MVYVTCFSFYATSKDRLATSQLSLVMEKEFQSLREAIQSSQCKVEQKLAASLADLKWEVVEAQHSISQEVVSRLNKSSYQFRKKENKVQFHFNSSVEESMGAVKKELMKIQPATSEDKEAARKAVLHLDEGIKTIERRQKHIKVTDHSEYGWVTVGVYEDDALANDSEDEKKLERAEKEAERITNKQCRGASSAARKHARESVSHHGCK